MVPQQLDGARRRLQSVARVALRDAACASCRREDDLERVPAGLSVSPLRNPYLIAAVLLSIFLHTIILYVPAANPIFYVKPLDLESWLVVLQICAPVCVLDELFKAYARATEAKAKTD